MAAPKKVKVQCKQMLWNEWTQYRCSNRAVVGGYCRRHDPERRKLRSAYQEKVWAAERVRGDARGLVQAYEAVIKHQKEIHEKAGLEVAAGYLIAQTAHNEAREAEAKLAQEKP